MIVLLVYVMYIDFQTSDQRDTKIFQNWEHSNLPKGRNKYQI